MKSNVLITNIIIKSMKCDSFCKYCYLQRDSKNVKYTKPYKYEGVLRDNIRSILEFSKTYFNCPIIKICGGEVFLMNNLKELVKELLEYYPYVLIQTNGKHFDENNLKWIIDLKRVLIQISLDGHNVKMNGYRFFDEEAMNSVLFAIETLRKNNVYLEIISVLNNLNTHCFDEFLDYLYQLPSGEIKNAMKVTPIYLIDKTGKYRSTKEDNGVIEELILQYEKYKYLLPPKSYMNSIFMLMQGERLKYKCHNSIVSLNFTDDGKLKACTNILPKDSLNVGDIFSEEHESIVERFGKTKFQNMLLETEKRLPFCQNCFNFCSIYNLYLNNTYSLEELCQNNYMYDLPEVKDSLARVKVSLC